jgi:PAS domain S-box-containing protein
VKQSTLTGVERRFGDDELIVTKTDRGGKITYANPVFLRMSNLSEREALGAPHSVIRHPEMPRCVFRLLWDTIERGREMFAYVLNRASNGDHYWVFAHVTPTFQAEGRITGYHSNRRVADRRIVEATIRPLYRELLDEERRHAEKARGTTASMARLNELLAGKDFDYEGFIFSLQG